MNGTSWNVGDWAVFDRSIIQIKEIREGGVCEVSDGSFSTTGRLLNRLRPLTLRNKRAAEWFDWHYRKLDKIRGSGGFNYSDISCRFSDLALRAIDGDESDKAPFDEAHDFIQKASEYVPVIQGIQLFREAA